MCYQAGCIVCRKSRCSYLIRKCTIISNWASTYRNGSSLTRERRYYLRSRTCEQSCRSTNRTISTSIYSSTLPSYWLSWCWRENRSISYKSTDLTKLNRNWESGSSWWIISSRWATYTIRRRIRCLRNTTRSIRSAIYSSACPLYGLSWQRKCRTDK